MRYLIALFFSFSVSTVYAVMPVTDIDLTLQQYLQLAEQFKVLQQQYAQLQRLETETTGSGGLGALFTDPLVLDNMPAQWGDFALYAKSSQLYASNRAKYPTSNQPAMNAMYDQEAVGETVMQLMFQRVQARIKRADDLRNAINTQQNPSTKAEMANRLAAENAAIANDNQQLAVIERNLQRERDQAGHAVQKEFIRCEFDPHCTR